MTSRSASSARIERTRDQIEAFQGGLFGGEMPAGADRAPVTDADAGHESGGYTRNLDGDLDVESMSGVFRSLTCKFSVELPGIEPVTSANKSL
jgi:hypothetical protein